MRKVIEHSEIWMTILGGLLYHMIFMVILSDSFYTTLPRVLLALFTLILGPTIFFLLDATIKRFVEEAWGKGLKNACRIFCKLHIIWVPLILITTILYVICTAISFSLAIKSPIFIISAILLIVYIVKICIIAKKC